MTTDSNILDRSAHWLVLPPSPRASLAQELVIAVGIGIAVCLVGPLYGGVLLALVLAGMLVVYAPWQLWVGAFVAYMVLSHNHRSFLLIPAGGIVWRLREFVLVLILGYWFLKLITGKVRVPADPIHLAVVSYGLFFALVAANGILRQPNLQAIVAECRYPIFLASYIVFVSFLRTRKDLHFFIVMVSIVAIVLAILSVTFFAYTFVSGNVINVQNALGDYVRRQIGPVLLQSVRPNGHMLFELGLVILASLLSCNEISRKVRLFYLGLIGLFGAAVAITMMRTAYVSLLVSLIILAFLALPSGRLRMIVAGVALGIFALAAAVFGPSAYEYLRSATEGVGASVGGRLVEIAGAWRTFSVHPVIGAGLGSMFKGFGYVTKTSDLAYAEATYQTVHNAWMYFLFKGGLVGFLLAAFGLGGIFVRGYYIMIQLEHSKDRLFLRGLLAAYAGQLVASLAMPRLTYPQGYAFVAMVASILVVYARDAARPKEDALARASSAVVLSGSPPS
ncbi:MAG TPA: O-antigen ligase family protein [Candidatus Hydrogenedentes bacterium]|nr:O-antigen ligase family protein [Candidatus Hydrogenedentota bacterium]HPG67798.1 O-antigen ligase family protein [Candidatus Hydrogenedentota bacterium]